MTFKLPAVFQLDSESAIRRRLKVWDVPGQLPDIVNLVGIGRDEFPLKDTINPFF